jgi:hypothetical protein
LKENTMRHKPYENWILEGTSLSRSESILLTNHLKSCSQCQLLQSTWLASEKQFIDARMHAPQPGFTQRWQSHLIYRREHERSRQVRRNLFMIVLLMVFASTIYMLQNHLLTTWIVSAVSLVTSLFFNISKALAGFNMELNQSPVLFFGFSVLSFGAILAFLTAIVFFIWNLLKKNEREKAHEMEN